MVLRYERDVKVHLYRAASLYRADNHKYKKELATFVIKYNAYAATKRGASWQSITYAMAREWMYRYIRGQ